MPLDSGLFVYRFKVINLGKNQVIDIELNTWLTELVERGGIKVSRSIKRYETAHSATLTLAPANDENRPWGLTSELTVSFRTTDDLPTILEDKEKRIIATLRTADAISRSTLVIQKDFTKENFKVGEFKARQSTVVYCPAKTIDRY